MKYNVNELLATVALMSFIEIKSNKQPNLKESAIMMDIMCIIAVTKTPAKAEKFFHAWRNKPDEFTAALVCNMESHYRKLTK